MKEDDKRKKEVGLEEEKKEGSPRRVAQTRLEVLQDSLPPELKGKVYQDEGELWKAQEKIGLDDLQIVLDSKGNAVWRDMPGVFHNAAIDVIRRTFLTWSSDQGAVLDGKQEADIFVSQSFARNKKRCPDFAIWGPDRLDESGAARPNADLRKFMNPHVIFQFCWANEIEPEKLAVNDMSKFAGQNDLAPLGRPNVLYLINAKRSDPQPDSSPVHGFDVYVVRQGELVAENPTFTYRVGENENVSIQVAPEDMGLPQDANPFSISLSEIRAKLEGVGVVFEAENKEE